MNHFETNETDARTEQIDLSRRGFREINNPTVNEGAPIGDADFGGLPVRHVCHTHPSVKREGSMCRGHLLHVVDLTVGGLTAVVGRAVPTSQSLFGRTDRRGYRRCAVCVRLRNWGRRRWWRLRFLFVTRSSQSQGYKSGERGEVFENAR